MPPENPVRRMLHHLASRVPGVLPTYRAIREYLKKDPVPIAIYQKLFEGGRLCLACVTPEELCPASDGIWLPAGYPLFAGEDTPLNDMLFLLNLARGRQARRILEVGTYRARTTLALHLNCPEAVLVSYDIQVLDSAFRRRLEGNRNVALRHASFVASADLLRREPPFDLIFVDGSHQFEHVLADSRLALELLSPGGIVVWHDYRHNEHFTRELQVPEALAILSRTHPIYAVRGTTCAVHVRDGRGEET